VKIVSEKIALVGDIHIGVNKNSDIFYDITKNWFKYFIHELKCLNINNVFILGDWHHYRDEISVQTLDVSCEIMNMFPKNINVFILTGNHDCYFKDNSEIHSLQMFKGWENVTVIDKLSYIETKYGDICVVPWGDEDKISKKCKYVFGHFEIKNFKMNNYTICTKGVDSSSLLSGNTDVYTGHFHKYQTKEYKNGSITYVGSPFQQDFNDVGNENGYHILDLKSATSEFNVNSERVPSFKHIKLSSLTKDDFNNVSNNFIKLIIDNDVKESTLDTLIIKINQLSPKKLIIDDIRSKKSVDKSQLSDNIEEIDINESIKEFIDKMGDLEYKEEIIDKFFEYWDKNKL